MSNNIDTYKPDDSSIPQSAGGERMQASRRRLLLNGMVKGSAIAASAVPIKTLAFTSSVTANGQVCSASGVESVAHSRTTSLPKCLGKSPIFFSAIANWPGYSKYNPVCTFGYGSFTQNSLFKDIFTNTLSKIKGKKLITILLDHTTTDEAYWIAALLNSIRFRGTPQFPYTSDEVIGLYSKNNSGATKLFRLINTS